ncbi:MAG: transglycosylase SLT domain-containing protein [Acidobacteriota bacterium]
MRYGLLTVAAVGAGLAGWGLHAASDPVADLKAAIAALDAKKFAIAAPLLGDLRARLPQLADYAGFYLAQSQSELKNYPAVRPALAAVFAQSPKSPLRGKATLLAADAYMKMGQPQDAVLILREYYSETVATQADMALADALLAVGDKLGATAYYQRVYFGNPQSPANPRALAALDKLKLELGDGYPPAMPQSMLNRAVKLLDAGQFANARKEFEALIPQLGGADRDLARVRIGVAMYNAKQDAEAYHYLSTLEVPSDEPDAERLYYLVQSARRLQKLSEMDALAERGSELYPKSRWTADALIAAANRHLTENEVAAYEPLYQACYQGLPSDARTDICHWKVTWVHYQRRDADSAKMLRDHLKMYPASDQSSAALYFLGRLSQQSGDVRAARGYFDEVVTQYPNVFYASVARERLAKLGGVVAADSVDTFLKTVQFPQRAHTQEFKAAAPAQARIRRAEMLAKGGLKDLAENELRFAADQGEQPPVMAMELAKLLSTGDPAQAMRYIKRYARGYLSMPIDSAPREFWHLAFPLPYRDALERHTRKQDVDLYLMAALIRQESEFDPEAVSVTNARGLSQIEPSTGRDLAKRLNLTYALPKLFQPEYNLQLGTFYFSWLTKQLGGNTEAALASYNAGMTRAKSWLKWGEFREPAEFIETVPITQTREYIQAVLRNAAAYREIYSGNAPPAAAE